MRGKVSRFYSEGIAGSRFCTNLGIFPLCVVAWILVQALVHTCVHTFPCALKFEVFSCRVSPDAPRFTLLPLPSHQSQSRYLVTAEISCSFLLAPTSLGQGDPWNGEFQEGPGLLAQRPTVRNVAVLGQAGTNIYTLAAEASLLAGIPQGDMWVLLGPSPDSKE